MINRFILASVLGLVFVTSLFGASSKEALIGMSTIRQRGMGNVGVAISMDQSALFNNPAGLYYAGFHLKMPRVLVEAGDDIYKKWAVISDLQSGMGDESEQISQLQSLVPMPIGVNVALNPGASFTWRGLGLGGFAESNIDGSISRKTSPKLTISGRTDLVYGIGFAQEFDLMGTTSIGVSAKFIQRSKLYNKTTGAEEFVLGAAELLKHVNDLPGKEDPGLYSIEGTSFDVGVLRTIDSKFFGKGHYGVAVQNIGATLTGQQKITTTSGGEETTTITDKEGTIPVIAKLGFGIQTQNLKGIPLIGFFLDDALIAADYMVVSPYEDFRKNIHVGIEKSLLWDYLYLRGGLNQGFVVGGVGLHLRVWKIPLLNLDYANYTQEDGEKVGNDSVTFHSVQLSLLF